MADLDSLALGRGDPRAAPAPESDRAPPPGGAQKAQLPLHRCRALVRRRDRARRGPSGLHKGRPVAGCQRRIDPEHRAGAAGGGRPHGQRLLRPGPDPHVPRDSPPPPGAALPGLFVPEAEFEARWSGSPTTATTGSRSARSSPPGSTASRSRRSPSWSPSTTAIRASSWAPGRCSTSSAGPGCSTSRSPTSSWASSPKTRSSSCRLGLGARLAHLHPPGSHEPDVDLDHEIAASRRELQKRFGAPVNFFCYPAGAYDDASSRRSRPRAMWARRRPRRASPLPTTRTRSGGSASSRGRGGRARAEAQRRGRVALRGDRTRPWICTKRRLSA